MKSFVYLDHAATSPLRPEARDAWLRASELGGNASSVHAIGRKAKVLLEDARSQILQGLGAEGSGGLVFTSGGTEANSLALHQLYFGEMLGSSLIVSAGEHDSIYSVANGAEIVPLAAAGHVDLGGLSLRLEACKARPFVCLMLANNETGAVSDVAAAARIVHEKKGWLHVDAVQALGKIEIDFNKLDADSLSVSSHKVGGPQGVGALIYKRERTLKPLITGSGQELGLRAGTENVAGISAFAAAFSACQPMRPELCKAQAEIEAALKAMGVTILGEQAQRLPGLLCLAQPEWASNLQLIHMDLSGLCVSSGSACSSGKVKSSRVASAIGLSDMADKVLRVSAGWTNSPEDWERFYAVWSDGYNAYLKRRLQTVTVKEKA